MMTHSVTFQNENSFAQKAQRSLIQLNENVKMKLSQKCEKNQQ